MGGSPASGLSITTSSSLGHTHSFTMSQAQLMSVGSAMSVTITAGVSPVTGDHTHDFTITKWF